MDGIEILNTTVNPIMETQGQAAGKTFILIFTVVGIIAAIAIAVVLVKKNKKYHVYEFGQKIACAILTPAVCFVVACNISSWFIVKDVQVGEEYIYEVSVVSDTLPFNEFTKRYDIIDHNGPIFIVKDKIPKETQSFDY